MAALLTLLPAVCAAQSRRFELTWQVPPGCPSATEVTREIEELVATSAASAAVPIVANASVASDRGGFALTLALRDTEGTHFRRIDAPTCDELGHAAALVVALAIDPALLSTHVDPGGAVSPVPPLLPANLQASNNMPQAAPGSPPPYFSAAQTALPAASPTRSLLWRLGLIESVAIETLPGVNLSTGLLGAVQTKGVRFELTLSSLTGNATSSLSTRASADFYLYRAEPRVCWLAETKNWALGPCSGFQIGVLIGHGHGVDSPHERRAVWAGSSHGAQFELRLSSSSLFGANADVEIPWQREDFDLLDRSVYRPTTSFRVGVSLAAGWQ